MSQAQQQQPSSVTAQFAEADFPRQPESEAAGNDTLQSISRAKDLLLALQTTIDGGKGDALAHGALLLLDEAARNCNRTLDLIEGQAASDNLPARITQ